MRASADSKIMFIMQGPDKTKHCGNYKLTAIDTVLILIPAGRYENWEAQKSFFLELTVSHTGRLS